MTGNPTRFLVAVVDLKSGQTETAVLLPEVMEELRAVAHVLPENDVDAAVLLAAINSPRTK